jgi:hypothetical protein
MTFCFWPAAESGNPDAKHPVESRENSRGKLAFPLGIIPRLSIGQKLSVFRIPQRQTEVVASSK